MLRFLALPQPLLPTENVRDASAAVERAVGEPGTSWIAAIVPQLLLLLLLLSYHYCYYCATTIATTHITLLPLLLLVCYH